MNIGRAFSFVFDDKNWFTKLLIPFFFCLIPIINFSVTGWGLRIARMVIRGEPVTPLPELSFGEDFKTGLKWFVVTLVYALPIVVLSLGLAACNILTIVPVAMSTDSNSSVNAGMTLVSVFTQLGLNGLLMIFAVAYAFILAAAAGHLPLRILRLDRASTSRLRLDWSARLLSRTCWCSPLPRFAACSP